MQRSKVQRPPSSGGVLRLCLQTGEQGLCLSLGVAHDQASRGPRRVARGEVEGEKAQQVGEVHVGGAEGLREAGGAPGEQCLI